MADERIPYTALLDGADPTSPQQVTVFLAREGLEIIAANGARVALWPYGGLLTSPEQPGGGFALVQQSAPRQRLTVLDRDFPRVVALKAPALARTSGCSRWLPAVAVAGILAIVALGGAGWWAAHTAVSWLKETLPSIADHLLVPMWQATLPRCEARPADDALRSLTARIARTNSLTTLPEVDIIDLPQINAVTTPGGEHIYLTRGLIERLTAPQELTAVLAHQLGHAANRHWVAIDVQGHMSHTENRVTLTAGCHTEAEELEADGWSLAALERAGLRSDGLQSLLGRIPPFDSRTWGAFTCTHPISDARLTLMDMASETATGTDPGLSASEWDAVRTACLPGT